MAEPSRPVRTTSTVTGIPLEQYLRTSYEPDRDYVDGVLEDRNVGKKRHSRTQRRLITLLGPFVDPLGLEPLPEQRVQVSKTKVRVPDVCVVPITDDEVEQHPPQLCIEIVSMDDRLSRLMKIASDYLAFGVPMIWLVNPYHREAFEVTQENPLPRQVDELGWNNVVLQLSEVFPE
jgi:Uma2 family endonuclease